MNKNNDEFNGVPIKLKEGIEYGKIEHLNKNPRLESIPKIESQQLSQCSASTKKAFTWLNKVTLFKVDSTGKNFTNLGQGFNRWNSLDIVVFDKQDLGRYISGEIFPH
jgi:hypothetical protein